MIKKQIYSIGFFIAAVLFAISSLILPGLLMSFSLLGSGICLLVLLVVSCICLAFSVVASQTLWVVGVGVIIAFIGSWIVLSSASAALMFLILFVPVGVALGFGYRNKKNLNNTVMGAAVNATVLGLIAFIVLIGELSGGSFSVSEALGPLSENLRQSCIDFFAADVETFEMVYQMLGVSAKAFALFVYSYIIANIPTFYMSAVLLQAVLGFWLIKSVMKRTEEQVSFMGRFSDCRVSFVAAVFYVICNVCYFIFSESDISAAFLSYSNILHYVFIYAGISLVAFFLELKNWGNGIRTVVLAVVIFVCIAFPQLSSLVSILGLFDSGMNIRERLRNSGV
ncbi:MAG: DUF2232 domain-containing protein [Clostridia bacterium]|nr:DUF2232 domain-containing protein [Clostridia bacterium]